MTLFSNEKNQLIVSGNSMSPTLSSGDIVYFKKVDAFTDSVKQSDLVAINFSNRKNLMVKRVIATEGDSISILNGSIAINGKLVTRCEITVFKSKKKSVLYTQLKNYNWKIPKNNFLVMGDNCNDSYDSKEYGLVSKTQIAGKVYKKELGD